MVMLGGLGTLHGAILGAAAFLLLEEVLSRLTEHWKVIFGPLLVLVVLFARGGILGFFRGAAPWLSRCCASSGCASRSARSSSPTTSTSRRARRAPRHHRPERRRQDDAHPPDLRPARRPTSAASCSTARHHAACRCTSACRRGLARSFQITSILPRFSALENVALAVQARSGSSFRFFGSRRTRRAQRAGPGGPGWSALRPRAHAAGRRSLARREAAARARDRARHSAEAAAPRRAAGRDRRTRNATPRSRRCAR